MSSRHSLALRESVGSVLLYVLRYCLEEVRSVSGIGEEVDEGYLETNTNLVSVVSTLSPFSCSFHCSCHAGISHVPKKSFIWLTAA